MLNPYSDALEQSAKNLLTMNAKTLQAFSQQQTELMTGLMSDSMTFATSISKQKEYAGFISAGQAYSESVRSRMLKSVQASYAAFSNMAANTSTTTKTTSNSNPAPKKTTVAKKSVETKSEVVAKPTPEPKTAQVKKVATRAAKKPTTTKKTIAPMANPAPTQQ